MLVALGATFLTAISTLSFSDQNAISRVITGLVTGIGFIGAGAIIHSREDITGLTSAAGLGAVAMIGLGLGLGYYTHSLIATILVYGTLELGHFEASTKKAKKRRR